MAGLAADGCVPRFHEERTHFFVARGARRAAGVGDLFVAVFAKRITAVVAVLPEGRRDNRGTDKKERQQRCDEHSGEPDQVSSLFHRGLLKRN
jgi:hypothetical protein